MKNNRTNKLHAGYVFFSDPTFIMRKNEKSFTDYLIILRSPKKDGVCNNQHEFHHPHDFFLDIEKIERSKTIVT